MTKEEKLWDDSYKNMTNEEKVKLWDDFYKNMTKEEKEKLWDYFYKNKTKEEEKRWKDYCKKRDENSVLQKTKFQLDSRLTEEEFITLANKVVKEIYIPAKIRYMVIIKKLKEYDIQPDTLIEIPYEFKLWEIFKKGCSRSNQKARSIKDERKITYIDYKELFKEEMDLLDLDISQITESTNLDGLIPNSLKSTYKQVLSDKVKLGEELRRFMSEKVRRLRLYNKIENRNKLDKPYQGPETQEGVIDAFNQIYTNELNLPLDIEKENEEYRKKNFFHPELWTPVLGNYKPSYVLAHEMINDPNFIRASISIWAGCGDEFYNDCESYGYINTNNVSALISLEYSWLIRREESMEKPDLDIINGLHYDQMRNPRRLISPVLLKHYSYGTIKRKAYEMNEAIKQQRQKNRT